MRQFCIGVKKLMLGRKSEDNPYLRLQEGQPAYGGRWGVQHVLVPALDCAV